MQENISVYLFGCTLLKTVKGYYNLVVKQYVIDNTRNRNLRNDMLKEN